MARYTANKDINDGRVQFTEGQEVDVNEIPSGYFGHFTLVPINRGLATAEPPAPGITPAPATPTDTTAVINPSRDELKAMADGFGLVYPANISTAKLKAMVDEAAEKAAAEDQDDDEDQE